MVIWGPRVSFDEVVGYWLNYEYNSRTDLKAYLDLSYKHVVPYIGKNDYANSLANEQRRRGLYAIRGGILQRLPSKTEWWDAKIEDSDTSKLRLINLGDWRRLTEETLKPLRAAQRISSEVALTHGVDANQVNYILKNYLSWVTDHSRLIILGPKVGPYTVADGVHRIVGLLLCHYVKKLGRFDLRDAYFGLS